MPQVLLDTIGVEKEQKGEEHNSLEYNYPTDRLTETLTLISLTLTGFLL
jgi:hypothetical protein